MRWVLVAALALALVAAAPVSQAQPEQAEACRAPLLTLQSPPEGFEFVAGQAVNLFFVIENPNGPPIETVRATITTTTPAGWTAAAAQRELTLGPRNVSYDVISVGAPHRGTGEPGGNITLHVTFVCTSGDVQTSSSASLVLPVVVRGFQAPWFLVLASVSALTIGVIILGIRRLRRGVAVTCASPERLVAPGKSAKFEIVVNNRRGKPQRFELAALGIPPAWQAHLALDEVDLEPGEEKTLWVLIKAPPNAHAGDEATVTLRLQNLVGSREGASTVVKARVTGDAA